MKPPELPTTFCSTERLDYLLSARMLFDELSAIVHDFVNNDDFNSLILDKDAVVAFETYIVHHLPLIFFS